MTRKENRLDQRTAALLKAIDKQIDAIRAGIDPQVTRALEQLLAAGLIVQDGERPNDTGKMLPAYKISPNVDRSKWDEILNALDADSNRLPERPTEQQRELGGGRRAPDSHQASRWRRSRRRT